MDGEYVAEGGEAYIQYRSTKVKIDSTGSAALKELYNSKTIVFGIRPNHMKVALENSSAYSIPGTVYYVEPLGDMNVITVQVEDVLFQAIMPTRFHPALNSSVFLEYDPARVLLFDKESGKSIG
jgi:ABC-type sugar transport system ATPase subunit